MIFGLQSNYSIIAPVIGVLQWLISLPLGQRKIISKLEDDKNRLFCYCCANLELIAFCWSVTEPFPGSFKENCVCYIWD